MMNRWGRLGISALAVAVGAGVSAAGAAAQDLLERTPNLTGGWVSHAGTVHFNFLHRFTASSAPERKVSSAPTFLLAAGLPGRVLLGAHYATNSELEPGFPNEWEFFARWAALRQGGRAPIALAAQAGYNLASEGVDAELSATRTQGPVRLLAAVRALSSAPGESGTHVALAGGAVLRLARYVAIAGDVGAPTERRPGDDVAWGVALQLAIPHTPHGLSLQVGNTNNATLQSASRGTGETRYGFEFTIPITLARYFGGRRPPPTPAPAETVGPAGAQATGDTVRVEMQGYAFRPARIEVAPGTTVMWTNRDQVAHTVTADGGGFDSGLIEPGASYAIVFSSAGSHAFHCTPHPFMTGVVVVR